MVNDRKKNASLDAEQKSDQELEKNNTMTEQQNYQSSSQTRGGLKLIEELRSAGTQDSSYYHTLLLEKEKEIAKLQSLLDQS